MRNSRTKTQTKLRNYIKLTAGALLLAITFVLVFAGTLSGAFGIENKLQQNGKIEGNVASAANAAGSNISIGLSNPTVTSWNINPDVSKKGYVCDDGDYLINDTSDLTWTIGDDSTGGRWMMGDSDNHHYQRYSTVWFDFDLGNDYSKFSKSISINVAGTLSATTNPAYVAITSSSSEFSDFDENKGADALYNEVVALSNKSVGVGNGGSGTSDVSLTENVSGRYVRIYFTCKGRYQLIGSRKYGIATFANVKVTLTRELKSYNVSYSKNGINSSTTVANTSHKYMAASNITSDFYVGNGQYFTGWNTSANGSGIAMAIGASTGTSTAANTFGNVVRSNLQNGQTTTTLYAQYQGISFTFNGKDYTQYNNEVLQVLQGRGGYLTHTVDSSYSTVVSYRNSNGSEIAQPITIGVYSAIIEVSKDGKTRGTVTLPFEIIEGDFGKIQGGTGKWGSVTNPYVISNETHLKNLSAIVNGRDALNSIVGSNNNSVTAEHVVATDKTYKDCYFVVAADLGADTPIELVPIGKDSTYYFAGTIFGGNDSDANNRTMRTITLNIQQSGVSNVGLFGYVKGATISHLTTAGTIVGGAAVGGLVGYADGVTISNCRNNATVTGAYMIGGLVGFGNDVTITSSVNNADITGEYNKAGTPSGLTKGAYVGGFVGVVNGGSIANCYNNGNISASGDNSDFLGGIAGYTTAPISYCASLKDKTIEGSNQVGGIVGKASGNNAKIEYCYFGGKINGLWNDNSAKLDFICAEKEDGSTVSNSWKLSSAIQGATGNRQYTNAGHSIQVASAFTLSPSYFDGTEYTPYTAVDGWQNILTVNINAFQILGGTESGKFLALHDGSNKSTLPNKTVIGKEKNSTGSPAKTDLVVNFIVYYNADTKQNVVAELKDIKIDAAAVDYNATEQYVVDNTQLPTTVNTHYFKQSFYFDQNGGGNATLGKTNAGTYKVYSDVWIRANNTDYLVGRKESTWTIKKLKFTIGNNQFFYGQDIENAIKNQIVIKNQSNVSVPKGAYTVVFGFNDTEHNFYGSIDIDQNQKEFSVAKTIISIYDSSNTLINDNFDINGFSVIVKAGDFGVQNNGINKSNIENNPWGSESNPYIIGTRGQLVTLSNIVRGVTNATNSQYTSDVYKYVKGTIASYGGAYFKLARSIASIGNITPIGTISNVFAATFDGNNNNLSGLNISVAGNNVGLFGYISGATIKNLTVNGSVKGSSNVGGVVGYALNSTIENVTNNASVNADYTDISYTIRQVDATPVSGGDKNYPSGENAYQINDGNVGTKYCGTKKAPMSFIAEINNVQSIVGFAIQNATDTSGNPQRTPKKVTIWGSNNGNEIPSESWGQSGGGNKPTSWSGYTSWVEIYTSDDIKLQSTDNRKNIEFDSTHTYRYYWVYIEGTDKQLQFAEFDFLSPRDNIGGVVGYASDTTITTIANNGSVSGSKNVGGIVGEFNSLGKSVSGATNSGAITSSNTAAGIVGKLTEGSISGSKNTGRVTASVATTIGEKTGAFLGGIAGWANGNVNNCYNSGTVTTETSWGNSNIVGGIVGFLVNGKTVSYCYNSGTIVGSSQIGGIIGYLPGARTTVTYCYHSGRINSVWNENNVAKGSLGYITGNDTSVLNSCWILPGASTDSASSTKIKTNGRKLEVGQYRYVPAIIDDYSTYGWTDILTKNINGFRVQESVNPGASQFFESKKGSNSTTHLTPNKTESSNQANALIRDNTDSFTITAWYGANTASDIYCAVNTIAIDISADTYNNAQLGFTRSDVTTPGTSGSVYGIVFDYKGKNHNEIFVCAFDSNGNIVAGSTNPTQVDTYNTTVFVKIGDIVVGKKIAVDYTIEKAALNVGWTWTDNLHANLYNRTGSGDKVQFVYNGKAQGLDSVSEHLRDVQLFDVTGNDLTNTNAATYTRTYTLKDTRNYKLQNANNNNADLSGTTVTFEWKIRKNKLTVSNYWTGADLNPSGEFYTFEYNAAHQGLKLQDGITFYVEPDTRGNQHVIDTIAYEIAQGVECVAADAYTRTFTIKDTTNYEVGNRLSYNTSVLPNQKGSDVNTEKSVVTYTWKIVPYSLATNIISGNVWFGGRTDLIVGNQGIANVKVGNANKGYYPLQADKKGTPGVQQVLVYAQHNYAVGNFVLYVKYNNGIVAELKQGTDKEYTVGTLDTSTNTVGTFNVNVVSQANPVEDTNVTARGTGNFSGDITKYYTALFSDFGWKDGKTPEDNDWGGSATNPYVISKPEHLLRLSQIVNGGMAWNSIQNTVTVGVCIAPQTTAKATSRDYKDAYFLVTVDIDMSGYISTDGVYNFLPIGTRSTQNQTELPFSATFDGGDNTITYVYNVGSFYNVDGARTNYVGLFGYLNGATISNLKVASNGGLSITDNSGIVGIEYVGGIAGYAVDSTLYNSVLAYGGWVRGETYVGGIVGYGERITIVSSEAVSSANVGGETYVGGIVGKWIVSNQSQIGGSVAGQRYVTPADQIDVMGIKYVGGIAGWMDTSSCATTISYAPQLNNNGKDGNFIVVGGIEYVGALFGAFIGNGYHQNATNDKYTAIVIDKDASDNFKVGNVKVILQNLNDKSASGNAKVVGGLVGYAEGVGILFNTDWTTSNVTLDTGNYTPSFIGGIAGVLGKNATIEAIYQLKDDGTFLTGGTHTITHSVPDEQKTFGTAAKPLGSFVGGIVGYVSSQAGVYWETGTTIFGNGISLVNLATIYATSYAGGIFGALGDLSTSVAQTFENDTNSILYNVLTTGVRSGNASTTLGLAPTVSGKGITAQGRLVNNASISVSGSYVGGIAGYCGAKVRFVLRNTPQDSAIDVSKLNIYSGGSDIFINGSYAGGIAGYLVDNLEHDLQYIVVKARFNTNNQSATRVGGLVGYMGSGNVQNCVVTNGGSSAITASTDTYQGSEYVGGLVGETQNATIRNSVSTGFNLEKTSNTKGGLLGYGANPTIDSSWTFYIAKKRTNFAKNATPNGAYYATVSQSPYGKYILVDEGLINATEASYPTFVSLCGFVGLLTNANVEGTLEFAVKVPNKTLNSNYENTQLAFYNASGSDTVTDNVDSFSKFENKNNTLTIALDMASGNSMQICVVGIEFVNVAKWNSSNPLYSVTDGATKNVENSYKKPSDSDSYSADVTNNNSGTVASNPTKIYDDEGNLRYIQAIVYFNGVIVGATVENKQQVGQYDSGELTPGSSATTPYTISNQQEWNDFAYSIYSGANNYSGKYVKLLTDSIVINTGNGGQHAGTKGTHNFGATVSIPSSGTGAPNNIGYNFAGDISKDSNVNNFRGTFDGNGHYITINYVSGGYYRVSAFPNAADATFRNLTIKGKIQAASQMTGANGIANSAAYDVAGFVGKPFGSLKFYNCTNEADIIGLRNVAGLVGYNSGGQSITFEACVNIGDITSLQGSYTLGGYNNSKYNYDDNLDGTGVGITNIGYTFGTGGIIGAYTGTIQIESCRNAGTIIGGHNVGGIIGLHEGTSSSVSTLTINNCANSGEIRSNSGYWGEDEGQIGGDASRGVRQSTFGYAGGLVGKTGRYSILKMYSSYNSGWVVTLSNIAGGLVGSVGTMNQPSGNKNSVLTGGRSVIAYCYNVGKVNSGGTFPKRTKNYEGYGRENFGGAIVGGVAGLVGNIQITQTYNAGEVWQFGIICYGGSWQVRAAGIVGQSQPTSNGYVLFDNVYNVGTVYVRAINTQVLGGAGGELFKDARYGAAISGYCDTKDAAKRIYSFECYSINNCVSSLIAKDISGDNNYLPYKNGTNSWESDEKFDEYYQNGGIAGIGASNADLIETGMVYNTYDSLTAAMNSQSKLYMNGSNFAFSQSNAVFDLNFNSNLGTYTTVAAINSVSANAVTGTTNTNVSAASWVRYPDSWLYVYGCLPQLSVFALDTQNSLSMRSIGYGQDQYGEFNENGLPAGSEQYPFIIKDGIDLMGMQALVDTGYSFVGQYIEVANGENNLDGLAATRIKFPTYASTGTAATDGASNTMFKAVDKDGSYKVGKSYHLLLKGAVFNKARNEDATYVGTDYGYWAYNTYYYNGAYNDSDFGDMRRYGIFRIQNFIPMGRGNNVFKGHFSGKQDGDTSTIIDDLRITTGKDGGGYGGLFAKVQDAYIGYISIGGTSKVSAYSYDNSTEAGAGGIVGKALGSTVIENCGVADSVQIGAYGRTYKVTISSDGITFAGGIAGVADPIQGNSYNAGITLIIRNCSVSTSGIIESAKSNIGGVLGYVGGDAGASGKGNTVRIEGCSVDKAVIQAASSANTSSQIGGILGYGSQYVAAFITGCKVGVGGAVSIKGEHSLGGIAGGMSNAKGGYIDSCIVGAKTSIERINQGGDKDDKGNDKVSESPKHGTAIGGLVGFTQDSKDDTSPLTTTFSGTSAFGGTITVSVESTNKSQDSDAKISCIGGIVGDMGSGANFASGSDVTVGGTIDIKNSQGDWLAAANVGGVAGRTSNATFIGKFDVSLTMNTLQAENVGGFIGKNVGTVYILADTTERIVDGKLNGTNITIGGTIQGTSEVGGFIGVNNSGSSLNIGSNVANAKPYRSGTLSITIENGTITGGDNVGGIVGKNEGADGGASYATIDIVKGTITQQGTINGANNVGGIIGLNDGLLTTGGGEADTSIGGIALSDDQIGLIKNLSITNIGNVTGSGNYVGGVVGKLDSPATLRTEDSGKGAIAGTFTNSGTVVGNSFVGGSLGFVGKNVTITAKNNVATLFVNDGQVTATGYFVGGSIGALVGKIQGENSSVAVKFENKKKVNATGFVGGSIGVLAGPVSYAQFVNSSGDLTIAAVNSVGGSVGYIGVPSPLSDELVGFTAHQIDINNTHFEASGNLTANPSQDAINAAKKDKEDNGWGGVGGAIGVMGAAIKSWTDNTYYANGNVKANVIENGIETGIYNVGGIVGLINAGNITISNMLAYRTTVTGGKNVGGIVGATNGTNTKILSAYTIEGTFSGTENVGGIIGLANSTEGVATDAKTSYWVKGYTNAILAGTDVKNLQQDLGKFETIIEHVGEQPIVFTEEFCKMYTPKTYYDDYPGTHTYNGKTITLGENVEQLTWYDYFKDKLGETSAQIKNGAWVKPIANAPTYTTGANNTGWYFVYATDKTIGTIKAEHSTNANLQYWKRIADAYTSSERNEGKDDNVKNPLASDIVLGNGAPQKSTLYATATAAGTESGYYLYMATSGKSRPSATNQGNKFYIQTLTTNADALAENVAVYYRTISKGKALTFNGYLRYAPVGITASEGETVSYIKNPETATGKPNSYCYSADTTTAGGQGTDGAQTNPGSFHSQVNIYYFDSEGKPHVVGGVAIGWTINKRDLNQGSELRINSNTREYGTDNTGDNHDVVLKIANIAPGAGEKAGFVIEIKSDNETIATFTWNGTSFTGITANAGKYVVNDITISAAGESNSQNNLSDTDLLYNVNEPGDKVLREFSCYIDFKHAKKYDIEVKPSTAIAPNNNKQWAELYDLSLTGSFTVSKKELKITGEGTVSPTFNGENHGYRWEVSGIVTNYGDTIAVLAAFSPQVCAYVNNAEHSKALYTSPTSLQTGKVTIDGVAGVNFEVSSNPTAIDVSANNEGSYYVKFATTEAGNYTLKLVNGDQNKKETNHFGIAQNTFTFTWNGVNGKHVYNGTKKGEITLTISTTVALTNLKEFIDNYFDMTMQNGTVTYSDNKAYVTFTTDVNAGEYYAKVSRKTNTFVNNNLHNCAYPSELKTNTQVKKLYKIDKRNLTLTLKGDGTYIYNTEHQGLTTVNVNAQSGDVGIISGDSVKVSVVVTRNGEAYYTYSVSGVNASAKSAGVNTINHGVYVATASDGGNSNYDIATGTANWTINKKELKLSGLTGGEKVYDGTAHTPTLKVNGDEVTNGTIPWGNDTISIKFSATLEGDSAQKESLVNVGKYSIKIGGTSGNAIAVSPAKRPAGSGEVDTSDNYTIFGSDSTTYEIKPRPITVTWNTSNLKFVYDLSAHGLTVSGINGGGTGAALQSSSLDYAIVKTGYGNDAIKFTLQGKKVDAGNDYEMSIKSSALNGRIVNDEVESTIDNYVISGTTCEKKFEIEKSQIIIKYAGGTTSKVYDAGFGISGTPFVFNTESQNGGAHGTSDLFDISYVYKDKNVGNDKEVVFTYVLKQNANYEYVGTGTESQNKGQITPAHIRVALDKLRSGKATRTYTDDEFYGGAEGATGNGRSKTYRTGEGFTVSGVLGSDNINVVARYQEADNTRNSNSGNYFDFSKYVNDVYKDADGTFKKASAGKYFKKLVFTMTGTDAANYTFNVYDSSAEGGNKYSESDSTAAAIQSVTVYDSRDSKNKNASGAASIQIEITVKSVRVEYSDTAQSYANDDNTYNTNWKPITGTNKDMDKADAKIKVSNGWMYVDGKDHTAEEGYTKREYRGYTTIRGSQNSERLGAKVDPTNGMDLNYRLSNQPTLTIAYFVSTGDEYEINSLARLLIASFYYTASQNPGNLEIIKIVSSGYKWVSVVSADDYDKGEFELPQDTPITDSKATTWDEYFTELEAKGYSVFLNIEANAQDNIPANTWGYYATTTSESSTIPTSYKLTKDIVGKFTESDISILNTFFTVIGDDGKTTTSTWSGNGTYLKNVLKAAEGKIATINGSLFVSTAKTEEAGDVTGFGGTFDGNGYVIEYLNIMGYGKDNVGLFDVIGANGIVKNLHLRNVTINGNAKYVGGIAGKVLAAAEAALDNSVNNVSFHGSINVTGSTDQSVGGLFGISERAVENAIVLGSITVSNVNAKVGGVVGTATAGLNNVVSMMQITASGGTVGAFTSNNAHVGENCTHMTNAVWKKGTSGTGFENVDGKNVGYNDLMSGSVSGYGTTNKYYHESETSVTKGEYDVLDDVVLTKISVDNKENARQSMRLADIVKVYLLMYSLNETQATDSGNLNGANVYAISTSSWLVGTADGTTAKPIAIANKQNVSLLRELRFASFTLKANVSIEIASTFSGAFYGSVTSATNESGTSYGYKITCDKAMFEAYSNDASAWLSVQQ